MENELIQKKQSELLALCHKYHVRRLELFGSAAGSKFDKVKSDLDFLVEFENLQLSEYADAYFELLEALEALFRRPVDLIMTSAIKNPFFLQSIQQSRTLLYAA